MSQSKKVLASATASASYNMVLQFVFRILTFVLNAFILRYISKDMLGVVNVRLTLLYTTILFVSREAFRRACLSKTGERHWPQIINLLWCIIPIGVISAGLFGYVWMRVLEVPKPDVIPHYPLGVVIFALSAVIEMTSEPLWVVGQVMLFVKLKVIIEGSALAVRCILTVVLVLLFPHWGLIGFSIAQLVFACIYSLQYYAYFIYYINSGHAPQDFPLRTVRDFFPKLLTDKPIISLQVATLTWSFFKQSFLKQLLTEGERYVMTMFKILSFADQGVYDVINNLGSLAARFIFLPIEDSGYLFFSQTLTRGQPAHKQEQKSMELTSEVLEALLKIVSLIGLVILVFGYSYSYLLLDLYGGSLLTSGTGPMLLQWYCMYVLLIAINGTTECFAFATMSQQEVDRYNHKMLVFSGLFLASSWFFTQHYGSLGFIHANCLNMLARILHSLYHTKGFYKDSTWRPLWGLKPSTSVQLSLAVAFVVTVLSEQSFCCYMGVLYRLLHVAIGGVCLLGVMGTVYLSEHSLVSFIQQQYKDRVKLKTS